MFKKYKQLFIGFTVGAVTFSCLPVLGANIPVLKDIKIMVNGNLIKTEDKPFLYNDRTYLPIRPVAESLGATVSWDGKNSTVVIAEPTATATTLNPRYAQTLPPDTPRPTSTPVPTCTPVKSFTAYDYKTNEPISVKLDSIGGHSSYIIKDMAYVWVDDFMNEFIRNNLLITYDSQTKQHNLVNTQSNEIVLYKLPIITIFREFDNADNIVMRISLSGDCTDNAVFFRKIDYDYLSKNILPLFKG